MKNNILIIDSKPITFYKMVWLIFAENIIMASRGFLLFALYAKVNHEIVFNEIKTEQESLFK